MAKTTNAKTIIKDGAIDVKESTLLAKSEVERVDDIPVHACGLRSHRDCPCWTCTSENCQACMASMF